MQAEKENIIANIVISVGEPTQQYKTANITNDIATQRKPTCTNPASSARNPESNPASSPGNAL